MSKNKVHIITLGKTLSEMNVIDAIAKLELIASVTVTPISKPTSFEDLILNITTLIKKSETRNFVVLADENVRLIATLVDLLTTHMERTVVFSAPYQEPSLETNRIGNLSNLINATHVASEKNGATTIVFGSKILLASHAITSNSDSFNYFETDKRSDLGDIGSIGFTIKMKEKRTVTKKQTKPWSPISSRILCLSMHGGLNIEKIKMAADKNDGVLIDVTDQSMKSVNEIACIKTEGRILAYSSNRNKPKSQYSSLVVNNLTHQACLAKFMLILGSTTTIDHRKLLSEIRQDISGEILFQE